MRRLLLLAMVGACYRGPASLEDCTVSCTDACPEGLTCGTDRRCSAAGGDFCTGTSNGDAALPELDAATGDVCVGSASRLTQVCFSLATAQPLALTGTFDTTACPGGIASPDACVLGGTTATLDMLRVVGARPLVVASEGDITITGVIDVGSHASSPGAGAAGASCSATAAALLDGGTGGSYQLLGGAGGIVAAMPPGGSHAQPGPVTAFTQPMPIAAGCPGRAGAQTGGAGGRGGGAIVLMSNAAITADATTLLLAGGEGGLGGGSSAASGGGGGGGAGGLIGFDATTVTLRGTVAANGGGGGGGGGLGVGPGGSGGPGLPGHDGAGAPASGGTGASGGGAGGPGSAGGAGSSGNDGATAGGGGGGAAGFVIVFGTRDVTGAKISPPALP